jgi:hypothetical protein
MRMKDDYMQNGQLKAGYNVQVATEGQFTLAYGVFPNPTDMKTLIPFLDQIEKQYFDLPKYIVADAGYGSEQNYDDILTKRTRTPLITYNHYLDEQKRKYRKRKIDVEPVFGFLKANLGFMQFSIRGKSKVDTILVSH